jgi:hypothetical protein
MNSSSTTSSSEHEHEPLYDIPSLRETAKQLADKSKKQKQNGMEEKVYPKPSEEELEDFKGQLDEWSKLEDQVRKLNVAKRERLLRMRALGSTVQQFMVKFGYEHINRKDGSHVRYNEREVKQPITLTDVKTRLLTMDISQFTGEKLIEELFKDETRERIIKKSLRRVIPKVSGTLDI